MKAIVGDLVKVMHFIILTYLIIQTAKEFASELIKEHDASAHPPVKNTVESSQAEKQDSKVSSTEMSSENRKCSLSLAIASMVK